jgi:DNA-binding transcriptional ArsR family regulator
MANLNAALLALSDGTRRKVLESLRGTELSVGAIADLLPVSRPAVSQHLRVLKDAGLVRERREGTRHFFSIDSSPLGELRAYVDDLWSDALAAYARHIETAKAGPDE